MKAHPSKVLWRSPAGVEVTFQKGHLAAFNYDGKPRTGVVVNFYSTEHVVRGLVMLCEDGGRPKRFAFDKIDVPIVE